MAEPAPVYNLPSARGEAPPNLSPEVSGGSKRTRKYKKHNRTRRMKDKISKRHTKCANRANQD